MTAPGDRQDPIRITEGPLSPEQAGQVLALADAARAADGVAPLSENTLLQIQHGSGPLARDLLLTVDGSAAGYAHLDGPDASEDGEMSGELVIHPGHRRRGYGSMRGKIWLAEDWDSPETNDAIAELFFGAPDTSTPDAVDDE